MRNALKEKLISPIEASSLIGKLEFMWRCSDILAWGKYYFPDKFSLPFCEELHQYLIEIAEVPFSATLAPRGHAKTTISCFLIPLYLALNHPQKFRHYLNVQDTSTKAGAVNLAIRLELETNELLRADYGDMVIKDKWTERQFVLSNGVIFTAIGAGESVRGLNYRNVRPDYVIGDDLYSEDCLNSVLMVRKVNSWFWSSIYKCVASDRPVCIHVQGTAISREDLMHALSKNKRWVFRKFQAVKDWDTGEVLWNENPLNTLQKQLNDKSDMGSTIYEREMQNNIRDDESSVIKMAWVQYYDGRKILSKREADEIKRFDRLEEVPEHEVRRVAGVDPGDKTKDANDPTGKIGVIVSNLGNYYVYDAYNHRYTLPENYDHVRGWHERDRFTKVFVETNKTVALFEQLRAKTSVPVVEIHADKSKILRLEKVERLFSNKKVFFSKLIPEEILTELVDQVTTNVPPHDDIRDALVMCLEDSNKIETKFY